MSYKKTKPLIFQSTIASTEEENLSTLSKFQRKISRFRSFIKTKVNPPAEAKIHDRSIKKHQKRLTSGAATRCFKIRKNIAVKRKFFHETNFTKFS